MEDIYKMKLHEFNINRDTFYPLEYKVIERVPGGWNYIYITPENRITSQFVPWHDSGRLIEKSGDSEELRAKLKKAEDALKEIQSELTDEPTTPEVNTIRLVNIELILDRYSGINE